MHIIITTCIVYSDLDAVFNSVSCNYIVAVILCISSEFYWEAGVQGATTVDVLMVKEALLIRLPDLNLVPQTVTTLIN